MIDRRDLLIGLAGVAAAGGAFAMVPRRRIDLMGQRTLEAILPQRMGPWVIDPGIGAVQPPTDGSLADRLYNEILARGYRRQDSDQVTPIMMLGTRGSEQSDALQLHRPEACYPAVGFAITHREEVGLPLGGADALPAVQLTAEMAGRVEDIIYWTRLGEDFPRSGGEQRNARLRAAFEGSVGDGVLMRFSGIRRDPNEPVFDTVADFISNLAATVRPQDRPALFGRFVPAR